MPKVKVGAGTHKEVKPLVFSRASSHAPYV